MLSLLYSLIDWLVPEEVTPLMKFVLIIFLIIVGFGLGFEIAMLRFALSVLY